MKFLYLPEAVCPMGHRVPEGALFCPECPVQAKRQQMIGAVVAWAVLFIPIIGLTAWLIVAQF